MEQAALGLSFPLADAAVAPAPSVPLLPALAMRLKEGDHGALEGFIHLTRPGAFRLACHLLGDYHGAQDVLQDAYLKVLQEIHSLRNPGGVKTWFFRIVHRRCLEALRKRRPTSLSEIQDHDLIDDPQLDLLTGRKMAVRAALALLSEADRSILLLRSCLDLSYEEISETLQIPMGTTKRRLCEARRRLVRRLMDAEEMV
ncbi:MAG TPA: RNA polymerase sigma factor [Candidatus Xenobia bacterium]|jgi:RNA polymerase sigma-70 factor (ECF subfamily)